MKHAIRITSVIVSLTVTLLMASCTREGILKRNQTGKNTYETTQKASGETTQKAGSATSSTDTDNFAASGEIQSSIEETTTQQNEDLKKLLDSIQLPDEKELDKILDLIDSIDISDKFDLEFDPNEDM